MLKARFIPYLLLLYLIASLVMPISVYAQKIDAEIAVASPVVAEDVDLLICIDSLTSVSAETPVDDSDGTDSTEAETTGANPCDGNSEGGYLRVSWNS